MTTFSLLNNNNKKSMIHSVIVNSFIHYLTALGRLKHALKLCALLSSLLDYKLLESFSVFLNCQSKCLSSSTDFVGVVISMIKN